LIAVVVIVVLRMASPSTPSTAGAEENEQDVVPPNKRFLFSTRDNSDYKWQRARGVVGCLEVKSEPFLCTSALMRPRFVVGKEQVFEHAMKCWEELNLRDSFIQACDLLPKETCCCGLMPDDDATIKEWAVQLNETWVKSTNKKLMERGVKLECFHWNWQNASGKAETNIFLIRFYEIASYRLRKASGDHNYDFEMVEIDDNGVENRSTDLSELPELVLEIPNMEMAR
jgi:hypothetical protein